MAGFLVRTLIIIHIYSRPVELAPMFPDKRMLGLEIRIKVSDYVRDRIHALRLYVFTCTALNSQAESGDVRQRRGAPCERHEVFAELLPQRPGAFTCVALTAAREDVLPVPRPTLQGQEAQVAHHQVWCVCSMLMSAQPCSPSMRSSSEKA